MNTRENSFLTIAIPQQYQEIARKFASEQATPAKGKRVYFNTLAVYMVHNFLEWMEIDTDLNQGESWHPGIRAILDVADLVIPNLGKLECRPVLPGETVISLPIEVTEDRIAYIGVQFPEGAYGDTPVHEVQLLGFSPTIDPDAPPEEIEIASLQPIETFIDYIDRLESAQIFLQSEDEIAIKVRERLADQPISEIAAQLERIYRTHDKYERRYAGGDFLASYLPTEKGLVSRGGTSIMDKGEFDDSDKSDLQDLAEELLDKLDEIWGDDDSD